MEEYIIGGMDDVVEERSDDDGSVVSCGEDSCSTSPEELLNESNRSGGSHGPYYQQQQQSLPQGQGQGQGSSFSHYNPEGKHGSGGGGLTRSTSKHRIILSRESSSTGDGLTKEHKSKETTTKERKSKGVKGILRPVSFHRPKKSTKVSSSEQQHDDHRGTHSHDKHQDRTTYEGGFRRSVETQETAFNSSTDEDHSSQENAVLMDSAEMSLMMLQKQHSSTSRGHGAGSGGSGGDHSKKSRLSRFLHR